ncbi:MAG: hypothetical protein ACRDZ3_07090 [Acidimicrobiia bacterium]
MPLPLPAGTDGIAEIPGSGGYDVDDFDLTGTEHAAPRRAAGRRRGTAALSVAIASLLCAGGVVAAERVNGRDLRKIVADIIRPDGTGPAATAGKPAPGSDRPSAAGARLHDDPSPASASPEAASLRGRDGSQSAEGTGSGTAPGASRPAGTGTSTADPDRSGDSLASSRPEASDVPAPSPGAGIPAPAAPAAAEAPRTIEEAVAQLVPFVEAEGGLTFLRPVAVEILSDADFLARVDQLNWLPQAAEAERLEGIWRAFGLIGDQVDLAAEVAKLTRAEALTFYDAQAEQLLVRSRPPTPYLRSMLVRELTKALDDQRFGIDRPALENIEEEGREGLKALVDGDATRVQNRYVAALSQDDRAQVTSERQRISRQVPTNINPAVMVRFLYTITNGPALVAALIEAGGRGRLDAAFAAPPTASEQVMHPDRYLAGDAPRPVTDPTPDGALQSRGTLGQVGLASMLLSALDASEADKAAAGWGGDRYVSWKNGNRTCVRATIVTDGAQDDAELAGALAKWASAHPGAKVSGSGPFSIERCAG